MVTFLSAVTVSISFAFSSTALTRLSFSVSSTCRRALRILISWFISFCSARYFSSSTLALFANVGQLRDQADRLAGGLRLAVLVERDDFFPVLVRRVDGDCETHEHEAHEQIEHDEDLAEQIHGKPSLQFGKRVRSDVRIRPADRRVPATTRSYRTLRHRRPARPLKPYFSFVPTLLNYCTGKEIGALTGT